MPRAGAAGLGLCLLGWGMAGQGHPTAGGWVAAAGAVTLIMVILVGWRLIVGTVMSTGLWLTGAGWFLLAHDYAFSKDWAWALPVAGLLLMIVPVARMSRTRYGSRGAVRGWARRSSRQDGVASGRQLRSTASARALRKRATVLRPSLGGLPWWRRQLVPAVELGTRVATVGRHGIWSPVEDVTLRVGGPRTGKTGELAGRILDARGAVLATSTRTDLITTTAQLRSQRGPVLVFNPSNLGGLPSTVTFDPLSGCVRPEVATWRAQDLIAGGPGDDTSPERAYWHQLGAQTLAAMLHAAALGEFGMLDVQRWLAAPTESRDLVVRLLRRSSSPAFEIAAAQFFGTNDRTQSSITTTISPALMWLTSEGARTAAAPGGSLDVAELFDSRGTLYLLGAEDALTAPLVTALCAEVAREARRIAAEQPSGRLDPPLTLALDEAAIICPVPLDRWTADMGGRNVTIHIAAQSRAQLRQRYGDTGAATILNNTSTLLVFGGTRDPEDLAAYVTLAGDRDEEVATHDHSDRGFSTTTRRVPVLTGAQIAQLPPGRVLIIRRHTPAAVGRVQMVWHRPDVRAYHRAAARASWRARHPQLVLMAGRVNPVPVAQAALLQVAALAGRIGARAAVARARLTRAVRVQLAAAGARVAVLARGRRRPVLELVSDSEPDMIPEPVTSGAPVLTLVPDLDDFPTYDPTGTSGEGDR